jgi:hypothetical protein
LLVSLGSVYRSAAKNIAMACRVANKGDIAAAKNDTLTVRPAGAAGVVA